MLRFRRLFQGTFSVAFFMLALVFLYGVIGLLLAFPVLYLWNWVIPDLFNGVLGTLTYWKAWGLIVLLGILFGNSASGAGGD